MPEKASIGVVNCDSLGVVGDQLAISIAAASFGPVYLNIVSVEETKALSAVIERPLPGGSSTVAKSLVRALSIVGATLLGAIPVALLEAADAIEVQVGKSILADMVRAPSINKGGGESDGSNYSNLHHDFYLLLLLL